MTIQGSPEFEGDNAPLGRPLLAGQWGDDDGVAIDEMFESGDTSPKVQSRAQAVPSEIPSTTRILTRKIPVASAAGIAPPILLFPADHTRTELLIVCPLSFRVASDPGFLNGGGAWICDNVLGDHPSFSLSTHTGPVWVQLDDPTVVAATNLSGWAVSSG